MPKLAEKSTRNISTTFDTKTFALEVIKRAAYRFSNKSAFNFRHEATEIICRLDFHTPMTLEEAEALVREFHTEVLDQDLRRTIAEETAPIRNAILGHAFSRTGLLDK